MNKASMAGNRLPVPESCAGAHFFYRTKLPAPCPKAAQTLVNWVIEGVQERGLSTAEIDVYNAGQARSNPEVKAALEQVCKDLGLWAHYEKNNVSLLVCEWASVHLDDAYAGWAFLSYVLHTGPNKYVMQTFHTEPSTGPEAASSPVKLTTSTRFLEEGDAVIFDPTTPHMAAPQYPHQDQLLILLQVELPEEDAQDRAKLLEQFPPAANDESQEYLFNAL